MGFRSTFVSETHGPWPDWFREKYDHSIHFGPDGGGPLASKWERSIYKLEGFEQDIQRAIDWDDRKVPAPFVLAYLHECRGVTRVLIYRDRIIIQDSDEESWYEVDETEHHYCGSHVT